MNRERGARDVGSRERTAERNAERERALACLEAVLGRGRQRIEPDALDLIRGAGGGRVGSGLIPAVKVVPAGKLANPKALNTSPCVPRFWIVTVAVVPDQVMLSDAQNSLPPQVPPARLVYGLGIAYAAGHDPESGDDRETSECPHVQISSAGAVESPRVHDRAGSQATIPHGRQIAM